MSQPGQVWGLEYVVIYYCKLYSSTLIRYFNVYLVLYVICFYDNYLFINTSGVMIYWPCSVVYAQNLQFIYSDHIYSPLFKLIMNMLLLQSILLENDNMTPKAVHTITVLHSLSQLWLCYVYWPDPLTFLYKSSINMFLIVLTLHLSFKKEGSSILTN